MTAHDLARALPDIAVLRDRCRALAAFDAVLCRDEDMRYHSFDSGWGPDHEMASMSNGSGDEWSVTFLPAGAFVRGFDHESDLSPYALDGLTWPGLVDAVPQVFADCVTEPAFSDGGMLRATACVWRGTHDDRWRTGEAEYPEGDDPDGTDWLFELLVDGTAEAYVEFAEEYFEVRPDVEAVRAVLRLEPLTSRVVHALDPDTDLADLVDDLATIGYPAAD